jgi:hypothetical protein
MFFNLFFNQYEQQSTLKTLSKALRSSRIYGVRVIWAKDRTIASFGFVTAMARPAKRADIRNIESVIWKRLRKEVIGHDGLNFEIEGSAIRNSGALLLEDFEKKQRQPSD